MNKRITPILLILPLLCGCSGKNVADHVPEDYTPDLPEFKNKDDGAIKEDATYAYLDVYEISDFHGATVFNEDDNQLGLERLSTYFDKKREDNPGGTILISGGDMWQGSADSNVTRGNLVTYGMRVMGFASMTFGNHEFDWEAGDTSWIMNNKNRADDGGVNSFPFLGANVYLKDTKEHPEYCKASTVVERGGYKIGIVGTMGDNIRDSILAAAIANIDFADEVETAKAEAARLRSEEKCDVVIWSTHNDCESIQKRISSVSDLGVDAIFGGHTHSNVNTKSAYGVPMLETRNYGRGIAHATIKINKSTKEVSATGVVDANPTSQEYEPDKDITGIYEQYSKKYIDPVKNRKLGKCDAKLSADDELGNVAVDSMVKVTKEKFSDYEISACFTNKSGGIRADIDQGKIIYGDVYKAFPFDNEIVIIKTKGKQLKSMLMSTKLNAARWNNLYETSIDSDKDYYYLTTDYLATNASFPFVEDGNTIVEYTKLNVRDAIADSIKAAKKIKAADYKTSGNKQYQRLK